MKLEEREGVLGETLLEFFDSRGARARFSSNSSIVQYILTLVDARVPTCPGDYFEIFTSSPGFTRLSRRERRSPLVDHRRVEFILELNKLHVGERRPR